MDKGGLREWFVQTKDWLMDKGGLDLWIEQGTDDVGNNTKNRNRSTSIAVLLWCHRLAKLILPDTIFRNKFDSHTLFVTSCN